MFGRRPATNGEPAFGHVDLDETARRDLAENAEALHARLTSKTQIAFSVNDIVVDGEIMVAPLEDFDDHFQPDAPWSFERAVIEIRRQQLPDLLGESDIRTGRWSFYLTRLRGTPDIVTVRGQSPTFGLQSRNKFRAMLAGNQLKAVEGPLVAFELGADAIVVDDTVYVAHPQRLEARFVDGDEVKRRAPDAVVAFNEAIDADLTSTAIDAIIHVASSNVHVARRVQQLVREGTLGHVTTEALRAGVGVTGLGGDAFGTTGPIDVATPEAATVLVELAADLYYQPVFDPSPRRVAAYRRVTRKGSSSS
ncbi:hypothetical protein GKE82_11330 [Conexibacter sp. W3-3-2]|uniref:hypothetical protein n=1 Tax=Conexibacter sp. W3-3-2 TaxID=2675227 RepID=UPI0012BA36D2|nr:hypothetical protein [Conexibacter sp. W3-3-2]MTD44866.1 hypothetical protein [Conexibacter sp. W3-3-2]